jgi:hypothetical protein
MKGKENYTKQTMKRLILSLHNFFRNVAQWTSLLLGQCSKPKPRKLHVENFQVSNGWLESFGTIHNINFRFLSGESAAVDMETVEDWKSKLQQVLSEYPPEDQFNADETGLFCRQMPRKSLIKKGEKYKGGKLSKER